MNNHQQPDLRKIGWKIRSGRIARCLSQEAFAHIVGISRNFLSRMENGNDSASIETYYRIACALGIPLSDLFREEVESKLTDEALFLFSDCSAPEARALLESLRTFKTQLRIFKAAIQ